MMRVSPLQLLVADLWAVECLSMRLNKHRQSQNPYLTFHDQLLVRLIKVDSGMSA